MHIGDGYTLRYRNYVNNGCAILCTLVLGVRDNVESDLGNRGGNNNNNTAFPRAAMQLCNFSNA